MFMPQSNMQKFLASTICRERFTQRMICEKCIIFSVCGSDPYHFDTVIMIFLWFHQYIVYYIPYIDEAKIVENDHELTQFVVLIFFLCITEIDSSHHGTFSGGNVGLPCRALCTIHIERYTCNDDNNNNT